MSTNFLPKSVFTWTNSDGSRTTAREYDYETFITLEFGSLLASLFSLALFGVFLSPFLLIIALLTFSGSFNLRFLACILVSSYVLFDAYQGWILLRLLDFLFSESQLNVLMAINAGVLLVSLIMFIFGGFIHGIITNLTKVIFNRWLIFILFSLLIFKIGYSMNKSLTKNNFGWVHNHLFVNPQSPGQQAPPERIMTDEEIEAEAQKDYEDQLRSEGRDPDKERNYSNLD
jgi:hypothetical protein